MATSDGISDPDWDQVRDLATELVNHAEGHESDMWRNRLLRCLDRLQGKYGELPSLLATQADYTEDDAEKERLLLRAYALALERGDGPNTLFISHSLAELFIVERRDKMQGESWLRALQQHLVHDTADAWGATEYEALSVALGKL